jgi:hypothetical protein
MLNRAFRVAITADLALKAYTVYALHPDPANQDQGSMTRKP